MMCMPNDPEYLGFQSGVGGHSFVYGAEYELPLVSDRCQHNAPCAVSYLSTQNTVIMIPAKTSCPSGWTREYYGYLMSERRVKSHTMYECVDRSMESIPDSQDHINGGHFYLTAMEWPVLLTTMKKNSLALSAANRWYIAITSLIATGTIHVRTYIQLAIIAL